MDSHPITLTLEVDRGTDPISGRLVSPEDRRQFVGWLGLASALETLIGAAQQSDPEVTPK